MTKKILLAAFTALSFAACTKPAIDNNGSGSGSANVINATAVSQITKTAFNNDFSGATGVEWQRNSSARFTVQFNHNSQRHDAGYDDSGHQTSHFIICLDAPVPQLVLDAFRQQFAMDNVYEWKLRSDGTWKAHFMRAAIKYEATFSATGALLKFERAS